MTESMTTRLTVKFDQALLYATELHRDHARKGGGIPYLGHLLSVAGLVLEAEGSETQAIAALLHDAAEDQGGISTLNQIRARFGDEVADIVDECSDTFDSPKPPWLPRKQSYLARLDTVSDDTILVSLADKLDNARSTLRDLRRHGDQLWQRFSVHDPQQHLWYYRALHEVYTRRNQSWLVDELGRVLDELEQIVGSGRASR